MSFVIRVLGLSTFLLGSLTFVQGNHEDDCLDYFETTQFADLSKLPLYERLAATKHHRSSRTMHAQVTLASLSTWLPL